MRFAMFALMATCALAQEDAAKLSWMAGCWETRPAPGLSIEEQWMKPAGGLLLGMGRTVRGGRTVFTEFLRIGPVNGKLTYTARIGTKGVTDFLLLRLSETEVVFENPTHDFPQRIVYRKSGDGLSARIEGIDKGKERSEEFAYTRVKCE